MTEEAITDPERVENIITGLLERDGKLPSQKELGEKLNIKHQTAAGILKKFAAKQQRFIVLPNQKIRTEGGDLVWYRNSRGSLVLACYRHIEGLGHVIEG